jgi:probable DNA repair protein
VDAELTARVAAGATIVTPNRRLARALKRDFDLAQRAAGRTVWPAADILPWSAWLERTWEAFSRYEVASPVLTQAQEVALWERIVAESTDADGLLDTVAVSRMARDAWAVQCAWRLTPGLQAQAGALHADGRAYLDWLREFRQQSAARGWLTTAELPDAIVARVRSRGEVRLPSLLLTGFDQATPQQRELAEALRAAGTAVEFRHPCAMHGRVHRCEHPSPGDELAAVAFSARRLLADAPGLRIGVVVPDLPRLRPLVVRAFDDALEPARCLPGRDRGPRPWNLSLGEPLARQPVVHTALSMLRLARGELPLAECGSLLRSPFLAGGEAEHAARARLDVQLRRRGCMSVSVTSLYRAASAGDGGQSSGCRLLATALERWLPRIREPLQARLLPSAWSPVFLGLLAGLGWPGERPLDSEEFQTVGKWREVVASLAALDPVVGALRYGEALSWLARLAADTLFQPESPDTPVQVLGVLESGGLVFDHLFVTGLHDEAWPPSARPNPLLPLPLQRLHGVPHASPEWEAGFAGRAIASWAASATHVVFSHPVRDGERRLRASPLIAHVPLSDPGQREGGEGHHPGVGGHAYDVCIMDAARLETLEDARAPALPYGYRGPGGAALFRDQAACPFRAFAAHRLGARPLEAGRPGLDARERGTLLHAALAHQWGAIGSWDRLLHMQEAELLETLRAAADAALEAMERNRADVLTGVYRELEAVRIVGLLARLAAEERKRAPFRVLEREAPRCLAVGGLVVEARVDRVDALEDGSRVLIDYKTTRGAATAWLGSRPDEPQLPLYAVTEAGEVAAVAFATLRADTVGFSGLGRAADLLPGVTTADGALTDTDAAPRWPELLRDWRVALEALATEFLDGYAAVAPKDYPRTCDHCAFGPFCRVKEHYDRGPVTAEAGGEGRDA